MTDFYCFLFYWLWLWMHSLYCRSLIIVALMKRIKKYDQIMILWVIKNINFSKTLYDYVKEESSYICDLYLDDQVMLHQHFLCKIFPEIFCFFLQVYSQSQNHQNIPFRFCWILNLGLFYDMSDCEANHLDRLLPLFIYF